jgi:hypothetical protein
MTDYEKLGVFYLGRPYDLEGKKPKDGIVLYDSRDLVTHAVCVGMTGSGKTGLCLAILEEAAIDGIPALVIDPKGDLGNLLLTFPALAPSDFRPWIDEDEARRKGQTPDAFASAEAEKWKKGLADWGQDGARIQRLRDACDMVVYTPGSKAGIPVSVLRSFDAPPPEVIDDSDLMRERVTTTATSLLGLVGIDADPIKSREHILLSTLLDTAWRNGQGLDVAALIGQVQQPPVSRVGVLEMESFFPQKERFEFAMALNNLLAAPGFSAWTDGEPLDVQRLLYTPKGKPRLAVFSIAHLNDAERMFFVSLLLNQALGWMRSQSGTTSLRALIYMDEIFGYLPPTANPPSKMAMLTLLKQARAFGVGMVLATQNPMDLDYKALSNAGTWLIGRLQTDRDQARVLDGLEGAATASGTGVDRNAMSALIGGLGKRQFLLHNVHEDHPEVFESRWAMSYLRGPLTRIQIKSLMGGARVQGAGVQGAGVQAVPEAQSPKPVAAARSAAWVVPPGVDQYFAPGKAGASYVPMVLGAADVRFTDPKNGVDVTRKASAVTAITSDPIPVDWDNAVDAGFDVGQLSKDQPAQATFADLPAPASKAKNYDDWSKAFVTWLSTTQQVTIYKSAASGLASNGQESEGDFRARLQHASREKRDQKIAQLRQQYAPKVASLGERLQRAQQAVAREKSQATGQWVQAGISIAGSVLGMLTSRKTVSVTNLGRVTTAARGMGRGMQQYEDVGRAKDTVESVQQQVDATTAELQAKIDAIDTNYDPQSEALDTVVIKPKRSGIAVQLVALTWVPRP